MRDLVPISLTGFKKLNEELSEAVILEVLDEFRLWDAVRRWNGAVLLRDRYEEELRVERAAIKRRDQSRYNRMVEAGEREAAVKWIEKTLILHLL